MKQGLFATVLIIVAAAVAWIIYTFTLPDYIQKRWSAGVLLLMLTIMVFTYIFERIFSLAQSSRQRLVDKVPERR